MSAAAAEAEKELQRLLENRPRILTVGYAGIGKSSIINYCFGLVVARAGPGESITETITEYFASPECPLHLTDCPGFKKEIDPNGENLYNKKLLQRIQKYVEGKRNSPDHTDHIHVVWLALDASEDRDPGDFLKEISRIFRGIPVVPIYNRCDLSSDDKLINHREWAARARRKLEDEGLQNLKDPVFVAAAPQPEKCPPPSRCTQCNATGDDIWHHAKNCMWLCASCGFRGNVDTRPSGFAALVESTWRLLPEATRFSFTQALKVKTELARLAATSIVLVAACGSAAIGAIPLPIVDMIPLLATEAAMVSGILASYSLSRVISANTLMWKIAGAIPVSAAVAGTGYALAGFLKWVAPGWGSVVEATVAAGSALLLGMVTIAICEKVQRLSDSSMTEEGRREVSEQALNRIMGSAQIQNVARNLFSRLRETPRAVADVSTIEALFNQGVEDLMEVDLQTDWTGPSQSTGIVHGGSIALAMASSSTAASSTTDLPTVAGAQPPGQEGGDDS